MRLWSLLCHLTSHPLVPVLPGKGGLLIRTVTISNVKAMRGVGSRKHLVHMAEMCRPRPRRTRSSCNKRPTYTPSRSLVVDPRSTLSSYYKHSRRYSDREIEHYHKHTDTDPSVNTSFLLRQTSDRRLFDVINGMPSRATIHVQEGKPTEKEIIEKFVSAVARGKATKAAEEVSQQGDSHQDTESKASSSTSSTTVASDTDLSSTYTDSDSTSDSDADDLEEQLRRLEVHGLFADDSALMDDDVLQLAGLYTLGEITDHLNAGHAVPVHTARSIHKRIGVAVFGIAIRRGQTTKAVGGELERTRVASGVRKRTTAQAKVRREKAFPLGGPLGKTGGEAGIEAGS